MLIVMLNFEFKFLKSVSKISDYDVSLKTVDSPIPCVDSPTRGQIRPRIDSATTMSRFGTSLEGRFA